MNFVFVDMILIIFQLIYKIIFLKREILFSKTY